MSNAHNDKPDLNEPVMKPMTPREAGICVFWVGIAVLIALLLGVGVVAALLGGGE